MGSGRERLRNGLVMTEIALAVMVVVGAGLLARSFSRLMDTDPGFNARGVLTLQVEVPTGAIGKIPRWPIITPRLRNA